MATRKFLIKSRAGVRLQRVHHLAPQQVVQSSWRLSTLRLNQPRTFTDDVEAEDAFDVEVIASLTDPIIIDMQRRGLLDYRLGLKSACDTSGKQRNENHHESRIVFPSSICTLASVALAKPRRGSRRAADCYAVHV